ncbi:MAG: hypothetical protein FD123_1715 [Bacteroidetes bacterium]|nr:MAG: hypothetical protein FD123_1715 [Bacteroidota bacterium]
MIKKLLFSVALIGITATAAEAQCVINPSVFLSPTDYGIIPDTITNLPLAYVGTPYSTDIQFNIDPDTVVNQPPFGNINVDITQVHIDSVVGLPAGFTYTANPVSATITTTSATPPGTGFGCVQLTGNPTAGQETGGPTNNGIYPIVVHYTGTAIVLSVPTQVPATETGYFVHIMPANGFKEEELSRFALSVPVPNPAVAKTSIQFNTTHAGQVDFTLYNVLGSVIKQDKIKSEKGINTYQLDVSTLPAGMYVYSMRDGDKMLTRRMTVTH